MLLRLLLLLPYALTRGRGGVTARARLSDGVGYFVFAIGFYCVATVCAFVLLSLRARARDKMSASLWSFFVRWCPGDRTRATTIASFVSASTPLLASLAAPGCTTIIGALYVHATVKHALRLRSTCDGLRECVLRSSSGIVNTYMAQAHCTIRCSFFLDFYRLNTAHSTVPISNIYKMNSSHFRNSVSEYKKKPTRTNIQQETTRKITFPRNA